ncbi:hypothetical protein KCU81_g6424, partial [Aureobasidium melanogenum]
MATGSGSTGPPGGPGPTAPPGVQTPATTSAHMIRQAGYLKLEVAHKDVVKVAQLKERAQALKRDVDLHGTMPSTSTQDLDVEMRDVGEKIAKAKHTLAQGAKSRSDLEELETTLAPLVKLVDESDFPKTQYAISITRQHRIGAWKFLRATRVHKSPAEDHLVRVVLGDVQQVTANLQADETRTSADLTEVLGVDKPSWTIDEIFEVAKHLRTQLQDKERDLRQQREDSKADKTTQQRLRTERNQYRSIASKAEARVKELEEKAAAEAMVDDTFEERVKELEHELAVTKQSLDTSLGDIEALEEVKKALEEANNSRRTMAEALTARNAHLERVIQEGSRSVEQEKETLAQEAKAYTSSTLQGLGAAFGQQFLDCYNEVQATKKQNFELTNEKKLLEEKLEISQADLARCQQNETFWREGCEEMSTEQEARREAEDLSQQTIRDGKREIGELQQALNAKQQQHEKTSATLQEIEIKHDTLVEELKHSNTELQNISNQFASLTQSYQSVASLRGLLEVLASCADNALDDGENTAEKEWNPSTVAQRIASALEEVVIHRKESANKTASTEGLRRQHQTEIRKAATASATVGILEKQLNESKEYGSRYFEQSTNLQVRCSALETEVRSLRSNTNKLHQVEKDLKSTQEELQTCNINGTELNEQRKGLKEQLNTANEKASELQARVDKLESEKTELKSSIQAARDEAIRDAQNNRHDLEARAEEIRLAQVRHDNLNQRYEDLEKERNQWTVRVEQLRTEKDNEVQDVKTKLSECTLHGENLRYELELASDKLVMLQGEAPEVEAKREELKRKQSELMSERERLNKQRQDLDRESGALNTRLIEVQQREKEARELRDECKREEGRFEQRESDVKTKLHDVHQREKALDSERATLKLDRIKLEGKVTQAEATQESLKSRVNTLEADSKDERSKYSALEAQLESEREAKESIENRLTRVQDELDRANEAVDASQQEAKNHLAYSLKLIEDKSKVEKELIDASARAEETLAEATAKIRREMNASLISATTETTERDQYIETLNQQLAVEKSRVGDLRRESDKKDAKIIAAVREQGKSEARYKEERFKHNDCLANGFRLEDQIKALKSSVSALVQRAKEEAIKLETAKSAKQASDDKLQKRQAEIRVLDGQVNTIVRHLWSIIFDGLWVKEYGIVFADVLIHWGALTVGADVKVDDVFPIRIRSLPQLALGWTLSMCTLDDMKRYYGTSFGQLFRRLALVLPIHPVHETALPIIEAMLHHIKDSEVGVLLMLDNLLMTCWSDPSYTRSDDRDLCDCRMLELIIRTANHHGRQWARLRDVETRWRQQRLPVHESPIVLAYRKLITDIMSWNEGQDVLIYSMPQLLSEDVSEHTRRWLRSTALAGCERTEERVNQDDPSSPRTLLAGQLFESIRVYALVDLAKQEAMLFRLPGTRYASGRRILTLPQRFGHHNDTTGTLINPGYTTDKGGSFEVPKPFIFRGMFFVPDHMPDVFDANLQA